MPSSFKQYSLSFNSLEVGRLEEAPEKSVTQPSKPGTTELLILIVPAIFTTKRLMQWTIPQCGENRVNCSRRLLQHGNWCFFGRGGEKANLLRSLELDKKKKKILQAHEPTVRCPTKLAERRGCSTRSQRWGTLVVTADSGDQLDTLGKRKAQLRYYLYQTGLWMWLWDNSFKIWMIDLGGPSPPWMVPFLGSGAASVA